jgi:anti-anti-sigma factor
MSAPGDGPTPKRRSIAAIDTITVDDRTVVVLVDGELDLWSAPALKRALCDQLADGRKHLVVDLSAVSFMDSTALGVLLGIDRRLSTDERLVLAQPGTGVLRLFELSGVAAGMRIFPSREAAIAYVSLERATDTASGTQPLTADAALLLGIAATAMPFAQSVDQQAERWLRALRRHGEAGAVLAALGVQEAPVSRLEEGREPLGSVDADPVTIVTEHAGHLAVARGATKLATTDVLRAVIEVYGETFARVLAAHDVDLDELRERLAHPQPSGAESQV